MTPPRGTHGGWLALGTAAVVATCAAVVVLTLLMCLLFLAVCAASAS